MLKKICNVLNVLIMVCLLVIALVMLGPKLIGGETLSVISGSMEPNIPVGSIVVIDKGETDSLKVDDVITYRISDNTMVTHRIVSIDQEKQEVVTKGDANDVVDGSPVSFSNIVGKVMFHVPYLGYMAVYVKTPLGIAAICGVVFVILLLNFLPDLLSKDDKENK